MCSINMLFESHKTWMYPCTVTGSAARIWGSFDGRKKRVSFQAALQYPVERKVNINGTGHSCFSSLSTSQFPASAAPRPDHERTIMSSPSASDGPAPPSNRRFSRSKRGVSKLPTYPRIHQPYLPRANFRHHRRNSEMVPSSSPEQANASVAR